MAIINRKCNSIVEPDYRPQLLDSPTGRAFASENLYRCITKMASPPKKSEIVVIGGGIVGCGIAVHLWHQDHLRDNFIILEPHTELCGKLFDIWTRIGQKVMRSPYDHHIAPDGDLQMLDFARLRLGELTDLEIEQVMLGLSGQRAVVPVDIFMGHTRHVISAHALQDKSYRSRVDKIISLRNGSHNYLLILNNGEEVLCNKVIFSTGNEQRKLDDVWGRAIVQFPEQVSFCDSPANSASDRVLVVGSGMTAAHILINSCKLGRKTTWLIRHEERYRCADFDTAFFRTEGIARFRKLSTISEKRKLLSEQSRGSIMLEFLPLLESFEKNGCLNVLRSIEPIRVTKVDHSLVVEFENEESIEVDHVLLGTGFTPVTSTLPESVTLYDEKYPDIDLQTLELVSHPGLHVAGALASLAIGPAAKNVDGARLAAQHIIPALRLEGQLQSYTVRGTLPVMPPKRS